MNEANRGRLQKADPADLDQDPFWSEVRRRHPDVDIVLLPPDSPADDPVGPAASPSSVDDVRRVAAALGEVWREIHPVLAEHGPLAPASIRWQVDDAQQALTLKKAVTGIGQDAGNELLVKILVVLGERGWVLHPGVRDGLPILRATDTRVAVEALAGPGATVVTFTGPPMTVAADIAQLVKDDLREEVASWQ